MKKKHHKLWDKNNLLTGTGFAVTVPGVLFCASIDIRRVYWFDENYGWNGQIVYPFTTGQEISGNQYIETNENDGNTLRENIILYPTSGRWTYRVSPGSLKLFP